MARFLVTLVLLLLLSALLCLGSDECVTDPTPSHCTAYTYPDANATADMDSLCRSMGFMSGCTIESLCASDAHQGDPYCQPFSILADVCAGDMPGMSGCARYVSMCHPETSVVAQCDELPPIPGLPTTSQANDAIKSMCGQHSMPGCEECPLSSPGFMDCDLLSVYSKLCLSMPGMAECAQWSVMCEAIPGWPELCPSSSQAPIMRMYFHTGILDYILFEGWVPRSDLQYTFSVIAVLALAFLFEALQTFRSYMEFRWRWPKEGSEAAGELEALNKGENAQLAWGAVPFRFGVDLQRAILHTIEVTLGYFLMLIAMTFNVGLFLGVLAGFFLGNFFFARLRVYTAKPSCCT